MSKDIHVVDGKNGGPYLNLDDINVVPTYAVTLTIKHPGQSKLALVKAIKDITGFGLRDSKEIVDRLSSNPQIIKFNATSGDINKIKRYLGDCPDIDYTMTDVESIRDRKLLELGIAEHSDYVEELANQDLDWMYMNRFNLELIKLLLIERYSLLSEDELRTALNFKS
jgi:Ribosomal protein L7/L12 C-terminal domain